MASHTSRKSNSFGS